MRRRKKQFESNRRRGALAALALVCLLVVTSLAGTLLQATLREYRQSYRREQQTQAFWLAESAVLRTRAALTKSADYEGEIWKIPAEQTGGEHAARVHIQVTRVEGASNLRRVAIEAVYGEHQSRRITYRREIEMRVSLQGEES